MLTSVRRVNASKARVFEPLLQLVGEKCPFPNCNQRATALLDLEPRLFLPLAYETCIVLCEEHAARAVEGAITKKMLLRVRQLLNQARLPRDGASASHLVSRDEYLRRLASILLEDTLELRVAYVGPLPMSPDWYFSFSEGVTGRESMDKVVRQKLEDEATSVRLILRNHPRFRQKITDKLPPSLLAPYVEETIENSTRLWRMPSNTICVADIGSFNIPIITDSFYVAAVRSSPGDPIESGIEIRDTELVSWEKNTFDAMFKHYESATTSGLDQTITFLNGLTEA